MKKLFITGLASALLLFTSVAVSANECGKNSGKNCGVQNESCGVGSCQMNGNMHGKGMMGMGGGLAYCMNTLSPENSDAFKKETEKYREQLIDKKAAIQKERMKEEPNFDAIAKLQKEMIDIKTSIHKIALKYREKK